MIPVIISGGSGTRLWPVSRAKLPKQFCDIFGESLQSLSVKRAMKLGTPWILTSLELKTLTEQSLREIDPRGETRTRVLYEPSPRNTAPALAFLCRALQSEGLGNEIVGILPSDHLIDDEMAFLKAMSAAEKAAHEDFIVTLGIAPTFPATGYGYIEIKKDENSVAVQSVVRFVEKPNLEKAKEFLVSKNYYWNAGIFIFKVDRLAKLFEKLAPKLWKVAEKLSSSETPSSVLYNEFEKISIDYAIMEKLNSTELKCVPCDIGWNDVGSWDSVADLKNSDGSTKKALKYEIDSSDNFLHSKNAKKIYSLIGIKDVVVVDTEDALLVAKKGQTQKVKEIVDVLNTEKIKAATEHVFENRPWGKFEVLRDTNEFKSKVIQVNPLSQLSYQSHEKREEHWIITKGQGEVVLNDQIIQIKPGSYVHIPLGAKHRIRNTGKEIIEFVEVQIGSYFGEDDIKRYQDDYQRT